MKITKSGYEKVRLLNEKVIEEKLMKKASDNMIWFRKQ